MGPEVVGELGVGALGGAVDIAAPAMGSSATKLASIVVAAENLL
jgi:hypothetical protein